MMKHIETSFDLGENKLHPSITGKGYSDFDDNGNEVHFKDNNGFESWTEWDSNGYEIYTKTNIGIEYWIEYFNDYDISITQVNNGITRIIVKSKDAIITLLDDGTIEYESSSNISMMDVIAILGTIEMQRYFNDTLKPYIADRKRKENYDRSN